MGRSGPRQAQLTIRGDLGKSARERAGRIVPLSSHLVEILAGWGTREGYLLAPTKIDRHSDPRHMAKVWVASKVPERLWGTGSDRLKTSVHHAFRKGFKTGLADLGVERDTRHFLVGHHDQGIDAAYVDLERRAKAAVALIPELGAEEPQVKPIDQTKRRRSQ